MNVLIATDDKAAAVHAIDEALRLLPLRDPSVHVNIVSVMDPELRIGGNENAQADLDHARAKLESAGVRCSTTLRRGRVVEQLLEAAHELKADVLVMGSQRRSGLARALLGSVAGDVMAKWDGALLIVKNVG